MISCIFSNGVMEINLQVTVKAFMPSVCHDYNCSPTAQDYSLKWSWKVHTEVLSCKVRPYHTKLCLTSRHTQSQVSAIKITALYRFITEERCSCSYPAANAKEIMQALNYPHDFLCCHQSRASDVHHTRVCWWVQFLKHNSSSIYNYQYCSAPSAGKSCQGKVSLQWERTSKTRDISDKKPQTQQYVSCIKRPKETIIRQPVIAMYFV